MVDVGRPAAINGVADGGVFGQLILQVHHRLGAPDEQDGVAVVQPTHLIWSQQFVSVKPSLHKKTLSQVFTWLRARLKIVNIPKRRLFF